MIVAGDQLEERQSTIPLDCWSHTLQLVLKVVLDEPQVSESLGSASTLVGHFRRSELATNSLKHEQKLRNPDTQVLLLTQMVVTRWNSQLEMASRLLQLRPSVTAVLLDKNITKPSARLSLQLTEEQWSVLSDITPLLKTFAKATQLLTRESTPTLSQVPVLLQSMVTRAFALKPGDTPLIANLKESVREEVIERFSLTNEGNFRI